MGGKRGGGYGVLGGGYQLDGPRRWVSVVNGVGG
jgi:hypothetical protein